MEHAANLIDAIERIQALAEWLPAAASAIPAVAAASVTLIAVFEFIRATAR